MGAGVQLYVNKEEQFRSHFIYNQTFRSFWIHAVCVHLRCLQAAEKLETESGRKEDSEIKCFIGRLS